MVLALNCAGWLFTNLYTMMPPIYCKELLGVLWTLPRSLLFWKHSCVRHSTEFSLQDLVLPVVIALASVSQLLTVWLFFPASFSVSCLRHNESLLLQFLLLLRGLLIIK